MQNKEGDLGLKIIHWEYYKLENHVTSVELKMKIFCVVQPGTTIKNGLLFRFATKLYKNEFLCTNCITENVFINTAISSFDFCEMKNFMQLAFDRFNSAFSIKMGEEGNAGTSLNYSIKAADVLRQIELVQVCSN
jgi:hypothetical protein